MGVRFTAKGWERWMGQFVRQAARAHLFVAGESPETLTEMTDATYAPVTLVGARWDVRARGPFVVATYPVIPWRFAERQLVAGLHVTDKGGDVLWWDLFPRADGQPRLDIFEGEIVVEIAMDET